MALQWIKSNVTVLIAIGGLAVTGIVGVRDLQNKVEKIEESISAVKAKAEERSQVADAFYKRVQENNIPLRVKMLEDQLKEAREQFRQFQEGQTALIVAMRDGIADLKSDIKVVSSKVDDLRAEKPRPGVFRPK